MDIRIRVVKPGSADDALTAEPYPPETPAPGEVRIHHEAIGVNFIDVYHRRGVYPLPLPGVPGVEGAGIVERVGDGVTGLKPGDRVAYAGPPVGAYAATRVLPATRLVRLPDGLSSRIAAATLVKGLTARMLLSRTCPVGPGAVLLVHAAAGGLGLILTRSAKRLGAVVIGTVGSDAKAALARENGADHVIVGRGADFSAAVAELTAGRGVDFAIDGVGGKTLAKTLACVRKFGVVASIGEVAGPIPPIPVEALGPVRSLSLARPSVMAYAAEADLYPEAAAAALDEIAMSPPAAVTDYPLSEAATAHADLEAGRTAGSLVLIP